MKAKKPSQLYSRAVKKTKNSAKTAVVNTVGTVLPMPDPPDEALRELFDAVQRQRIYDDGKTFVDMRPIGKVKSIMKAYRKQRQKPDFDLAQFIDQNFLAPQYPAPNYQPTVTTTARNTLLICGVFCGVAIGGIVDPLYRCRMLILRLADGSTSNFIGTRILLCRDWLLMASGA